MLPIIEAILMNVNPFKEENQKLKLELDKYKEKYGKCCSELELLLKKNDELSCENGDLQEEIDSLKRDGEMAVERYITETINDVIENIANQIQNMDESDISYSSFDFDDYM